MSNDTPTPANDLAAKIAEAIHEVAALEGDLSLPALRAIIGTHLAPTLDALAAAQAERDSYERASSNWKWLYDESQAELARLRAEVGDRKQSEHLLLQSIAFQEQRADAAESALRLAKEDGGRLDWLQKNCVFCHGPDHLWTHKFETPALPTDDYEKPTVRAAIDAARQKLPEVKP